MSEKARHVWAALVLVLVVGVAAVTLPRHTVGDSKGLAAIGAAAATFLSFMVLAFLAAVYAFIAAWRFRSELPPFLRYAGLIPLPCLLAAAAFFWFRVITKPGPPVDVPPGLPTQPVAVSPNT